MGSGSHGNVKNGGSKLSLKKSGNGKTKYTETGIKEDKSNCGVRDHVSVLSS